MRCEITHGSVMSSPDTTNYSGDVIVSRDIMIPMRDGIRLATDIYRPAAGQKPLAGKFPVLLERTPYDKSGTNHADRTRNEPAPLSKPEIAVQFARAGYIVAIQDCRGRYGSEGVFEKYLNEGQDGYDTLQWLTGQAWCNGKIGTYGLSYGAHTQAALASLDPPGLASMFMDSGGFSSAFHSGIRQGGAFELKQATWAYKHALLSPATLGDPARRQALESEDLISWFRRIPWSKGQSPLRAAPEYEDYLLEQWRSGQFGPAWMRVGLYARGYYDQFPDIPMVFMSSWYDPYSRTACENYEGLSRIKRGPLRLVLGPWTHGQRSVTHAGQVDFGSAATLDANIAPDYVAMRVAWFDRTIKGLPAPDYLPQAVKIFVMGGGAGKRDAAGRLQHGGTWRDEPDWPLPGAVPTPFYLKMDGSLDPAPSTQFEASQAFIADPGHPVPTVGGAIASGAPVMEAGAYDQRETSAFFAAAPSDRALGDREDVLVFQTAPLEQATEVTGPIEATLYISSSAPDADITIKLIDVYPPNEDWPEGFAMNLTHGILRLRYRDGFEQPALLQPGTVYKVRVEAFPTANLFAAGHRIRLDIAGSNFPHFDVNPNSGEPDGQADHPQVAQNRLYLDHDRPSFITLPLVPRG